MARLGLPAVLFAVVLVVLAGCGGDGDGGSEPTCDGTLCDGVCVDTTSDEAHCGACGNACAQATACVDGACCPAGQIECDGACTDPSLRTSCGGCGVVCGDDEACAVTSRQSLAGGGAIDRYGCVGCGEGETLCGDACVDLALDPRNCGACGNACPAGQVCADGACSTACAEGMTDCDGVCRNLLGDGSHCGACGNACRSDQLCMGGTCGCQLGRLDCDGTCINPQIDPGNCGGCGNVCGAGQVCVDGMCRCGQGTVQCGSRCIDTSSDPLHCGGCGQACIAGAECIDGTCSCPEPTVECGGRCVDFATDRFNCGTCGNACAAEELCDLGNCSSGCRTGTVDCDGFCVDLQTNTGNCGACGNACLPGEACRGGECQPELLPDLSVDATYLANTLEIQTRSFNTSSCAWVEGCLNGLGERRLLRFGTRTPNFGTADLNIGPPAGNPNLVWSPCHGHYHFEDYAEYRLVDMEGNVVATGHKQAFCLMDINRLDPNAPRTSGHYGCSNQGISMGWADTYSAGTECQWIDITGVPAGQYQVEIHVNPARVFGELDYSNNISRATIEIPHDPNACVPTAEICFNGIDEDCTGEADDTCPPITGNDACANAFAVTQAATYKAEVTPSTVDDVASSCGGAGGGDVFFKLDLAQEQLVYLSTFGSQVPTSLAVRSGSCGGAEAFCVDDACSTQQEQWVGVLPAGTHYVVVEAYGVTAPSIVQLKVQLAGCTGVQPLTSGIPVSGNTTGRTSQRSGCNSNSAAGAGPDESWYFTTCPGTHLVNATTCGTAWDTVLHLSRGTCAGASYACNDDDSSCTLSLRSSKLTDILVEGDGLWFVTVDGYTSGTAGPYDLTVSW